MQILNVYMARKILEMIFDFVKIDVLKIFWK
jgi:hypothetical protein